MVKYLILAVFRPAVKERSKYERIEGSYFA